METKIIALGEAWEAVERLRICVDYNPRVREWCAATREPIVLGWGATPLQAVAQLLERIGKTANASAKVEVAI